METRGSGDTVEGQGGSSLRDHLFVCMCVLVCACVCKHLIYTEEDTQAEVATKN